ncbi:MAG: lamin tail domain-containing protein [Rhodothermales bacterium]
MDMSRLLWCGAALLFMHAFPAAAQFTDDFSDGNFSLNPPWAGTTDRWIVADLNDSAALRSDGRAEADTIYLTTPSTVSRGAWTFTFSYQGVNLSNFNGARMYLMADTPNLSRDVFGYFLQLGTNNSDEVRLYRQDGAPSTQRVLLGRSTEALLAGTDQTLEISVTRSEEHTWSVRVNATQVLTATDSTYLTSRFFGVWVKHRSTTSQSYFFDDFEVQGDGGPPDTTPPEPIQATYIPETNDLRIDFSEPLDPATITPAAFEISGIGLPDTVRFGPLPPTSVSLGLGTPLPPGTYTVTFSDLADLSGNIVPEGTSLSFSFDPDSTPPQLVTVEAPEAHRVEVIFSEVVHGCFPERYDLSPGIGRPEDIEACVPEGQSRYVLRLADRLMSGTPYTLTVRDIADLAGNVLAEASATFFFVETDSTPPAPADIVINELFYAPPNSDLEFIELFNRSDQTVDLKQFVFSDNRLKPEVITDRRHPFSPGDYAVLARNGTAFRAEFPGVPFIEPPGWPALNNNGDTAILFFENTVIDSVAYAPGWGGDGVSLERKDPGGPSNSRFNFGSSVAETGATPGAQNSIFAPDTSPPTLLFAEQVENNVVDLFLDEPVTPASALPDAFTLDDGRVPDRVTLLDEDTRLTLRFSSPLSGLHLTATGLRDLTGNTLSGASLVLAYRARPGDVVVNEIMFDPLARDTDAYPDQPEYVELYNRTPRALTLRHHYWTDVPDAEGTADTLRFGPDFRAIAPGRFAVVFADRDASNHPAVDSKLARAFPDIDFAAGTAVLIPLPRASLSLVNTGDLLHLHRPDDVPLDSVFYDPDWHHPNLIEANGVSLERIEPDGSSNDRANWTSSLARDGGTPGQPNSVFRPPDAPSVRNGLTINPSPFSPDQDGFDDRTEIRYRLSQVPSLIRVRIFDTYGRLVRTLEDAGLAGPTGQLTWDGLDDGGRTLRIGIYVILFEALNTRGGTTEVFKEPVVLARSPN